MAIYDQKYQDLLKNILDNGYDLFDELHQTKMRALPGINMQIDLEKDGFPLLALRKTPIKSFIAEQIWFLMGEKNPKKFLEDYTKIWSNFVEEDGEIASAYGYRWRKHFGRDQIGDAIKLLQKNKYSRHAVIIAWDPSDDGLGSGTVKKNVPCPYTFTLNILGGKLHLHNIIRSQDALLGHPTDTAGFAFLLMILAQKLNVKPGKLTISMSNVHLYDNQIEIAKELLKRNANTNKISFNLPENSFDRAEIGDKSLFEEVFNLIKDQYNPNESIGKVKISEYENIDAMLIE
jgi:thymidylate synthase